MAGVSNIQWCEPCGRVGENQQAHSWCIDCSEPLCEECLKSHPKGKTTANHKSIPIMKAEKLGSVVLNIPETCDIHEDQSLSFFCVHHDTLCCAFCLRESHTPCEDVKSIAKASKGVKMGTAIDDLQRRISDFSLIVGKIVDVYKNNLISISDQKDKYKEEIRNFRKELNTYMDALEIEIHKKIDACEKECSDEIEKNIKDLTNRKHKSESRQTAIFTLTEHASETKIFAAIKTIDLLQAKEEVLLSKIQENLSAYEVRSTPLDFIEDIKTILSTISEIQIEKIKTTVQHLLNPQQVHAYKMQQEKVKLIHQIGYSQLHMRSFDQACFTMDDRIVFSGIPICVYDIFTSRFHEVKIKFPSMGIACDLKNNTFASFPGKGVYSIDTRDLIQGPRINNSKYKTGDYECIKLHNDLIYVTIRDEIVLFDGIGNVVKTLKCKFSPTFMCLDKYGGIFISDGKSIVHMTETSSDNTILNNISDDIITGLDVDEQGQLYACFSNNQIGTVMRINTSSGYKSPVLENLVTPRDIAFHPSNNEFLVITDHGEECSTYQVIY